jgi:hypothetical protein
LAGGSSSLQRGAIQAASGAAEDVASSIHLHERRRSAHSGYNFCPHAQSPDSP